MRSKMTRHELNTIVESVIEELRECEYGEEKSVAGILADLGYNVRSMVADEQHKIKFDLFDITNEVWAVARKNHIRLENPSGEGRQWGLPWNSCFIVKNKSAQK